ncbi:MAG: sulfur carrier protein ThiS [Elusimicrobia bacterium]|nr:sulfur carrier protein ThiS [Elusimicrobiota bacterium]
MIEVNGRKLSWRRGLTVSDVLAEAGYDFAHITVTVNGVFVAPDDFGAANVPDGADVKAIHLHHGG